MELHSSEVARSSDIGVKTSETWLRLSSGSTASFHSTGSFGLSGKWSCILLNASISIVLKPESFVTVMSGAFSHSACLMSLSYKLKEKNEKKTSVRKPWIRKFIGIQLLVQALFLFSFGNMLVMLGFITKELIQVCGFPLFTVKTFSRNGFFCFVNVNNKNSPFQRRYEKALKNPPTDSGDPGSCPTLRKPFCSLTWWLIQLCRPSEIQRKVSQAGVIS